MEKITVPEWAHTAGATQRSTEAPPANDGLPNRLLTAMEVAFWINVQVTVGTPSPVRAPTRLEVALQG